MKHNRKIAIDLIPTQPNNIHKHHGGGEYAKRLFYEIAKNVKEQDIVCIYDSTKPLLNDIRNICQEKKIELIKIESYGNLENVLTSNGVTRFYSALPNILKWTSSNIDYIYTIHGLRVIEMPTDKYEYLFSTNIKDYARYIFKQLFKQKYIDIQKGKFQKFLSELERKTIIVPSLHTKYSILENFPQIKSEELKVLYSPRTEVNLNMDININEQFNVSPKKFMLLILGSRWIKNNYRAIKAIDEIYSQNTNITQKTLVLGINENKNIYEFVKNKNRFIFTGYVNADTLERLYKEAFLFIYPTLNEGFGYPPLEAMKYGTPVIASAISSVTEVCGDAVLYFNPFSISEIKCRILQIINDNETVEVLEHKGKKRFEEIKEKQNCMLEQLVELILR